LTCQLNADLSVDAMSHTVDATVCMALAEAYNTVIYISNITVCTVYRPAGSL